MKKEFNLKKEVLLLGNYLENQNYYGIDVDIRNKPEKLSTTLGFSCMGWINLYKSSEKIEYLDKADRCLAEIIKTIDSNKNLWLFPFKFRNNPKNFPYSCENFMTLEAIFYYLENIEKKEELLVLIKKILKTMIREIGFSEEGCFWYSSRDKIEVPNISSMAANVFAKAYSVFNEKEYLQKANLFANYCINNQRKDGGV